MNVSKRIIRVYIHPDEGPVTPMELDITNVQLEMDKVTQDRSSDEVAVREIARQISKKFSGIQPESDKRQLVLLMRRWSSIEAFNGVVLRLGGTIENKTPDVLTANRLRAMPQEISQLANALESERRKTESLQVRVQQLEAENRRSRSLYDRANNEAINLRLLVQQAQDAVKQEQRATAQVREDAIQAIEQASRNQVLLDRANLELQARPTKAQHEKELADLRRKEREARGSDQQLRDTIASLQQENAVLQDSIRKITEFGGEDQGYVREAIDDESDLYAL